MTESGKEPEQVLTRQQAQAIFARCPTAVYVLDSVRPDRWKVEFSALTLDEMRLIAKALEEQERKNP